MKWDKEIDINPEDETSYATQYQEACLTYMENEYSAKHRRVLVNKPDSVPNRTLVPAIKAVWTGQSSFDRYDFSIYDEEYSELNTVVEMTSSWSIRAASILSAAFLYLNSPPEVLENWGQIDLNLNLYNSDPMEICSTLWILDITDWWRQQKDIHSSYTDLSYVACNIFSLIPHGA